MPVIRKQAMPCGCLRYERTKCIEVLRCRHHRVLAMTDPCRAWLETDEMIRDIPCSPRANLVVKFGVYLVVLSAICVWLVVWGQPS